MNTIRPEVQAPIMRVAEKQEEFEAVDVALVVHPDFEARSVRIRDDKSGPENRANTNTHLLAFKPDAEELAMLNAGAAVYVGLLTGGFQMQPIMVLVGKEKAAEVYNVGMI